MRNVIDYWRTQETGQPAPAAASIPLPPPMPPTLAWRPLLGAAFLIGVAILVYGVMSRPVASPADVAPAAPAFVAPTMTVALPAALLSPLPLPTVTLMTPPRARVDPNILPVVCQDGAIQRGYAVPDAPALTVILARHAGECFVAGGTGWTVEAQQAWYTTHAQPSTPTTR